MNSRLVIDLKIMENIKRKIEKLPSLPGIYLFKDANEEILYIGKAKDLKKRVASHFKTENKKFWNFVPKIQNFDFFECRNEKEAIILESEMIKKYQPKYNIDYKGGKNYIFIAVTKEDFPKIFLTHGKKLRNQKLNLKTTNFLGPFVGGKELRRFLKELRKIIPFRSCDNLPDKTCIYHDLGLCFGPCVKKKKKEYQKIIQSFKVLIEIYLGRSKRIEAYDISNLSGSLAAGSMIVFDGDRRKKSDYRKFKIKTVKNQNDVKSLREIILRRMGHFEWKIPDLILIDGGKPQLKAAKKINIPVLVLAKNKKHSGKIFSPYSKRYVLIDDFPPIVKNLFLRIRGEAHRFAINYQKKRRIKNLKIQ